jgi:hypothetical protein
LENVIDRPATGQRRQGFLQALAIHMRMTIDQAGRDQPTARVDPPGLGAG